MGKFMLVYSLFITINAVTFGDPTKDAEGYPADLFAIMAPGAMIGTNTIGYSLLMANGKSIQVTRQGRSYLFTDNQTREVTRADRDTAGWSIYRGTRNVGRISLSPGRADARIGNERRHATKTSAGYITTVSTNNAELYFQHLYRQDK